MVQFYKGMPFVIKVSKDRYLDKQVVCFTSPQNIELDVNRGMATSVKFYPFAPKVTVSGKFPSGIEGSASGFVAPQGRIYYNNAIAFMKGNATLDNGIASGFSGSNYLYMGKSFPTINQMDMVTKIKLTYNNNGVFFDNPNNKHLGIYDKKLAIYNNGWIKGATILATNVWYWVKCIKNGGTSKYYLLQDKGYELDTLPDISQWGLEITNSADLFSNCNLKVGYNASYAQEYFRGLIDLNNTVFDINGERFWDKYTEGLSYLVRGYGSLESGEDVPTSTDYTVFYKEPNILLSKSESVPNYAWVGYVTVPEHTNTKSILYGNFKEIGEVEYVSNGTSFGADSYIEADKTLPAQDYFQTPMSCTVRVKTPNSTSGIHTIMKSVESNGYFGINGDKWDLDGVLSTTTFNKNSVYWVTVQFDKDTNKYFMCVLEDLELLYNDSNLPPLSAWTKVASTQFNPFGSKNHVIFGRDWNGYMELNNLSISTMSPTEDKKLYWRAIS